jgi:hypothetical protein
MLEAGCAQRLAADAANDVGATSLLSGLLTPRRYLQTRNCKQECGSAGGGGGDALPHVAAQLVGQAVLGALAQTRDVNDLGSRDHAHRDEGGERRHTVSTSTMLRMVSLDTAMVLVRD